MDSSVFLVLCVSLTLSLSLLSITDTTKQYLCGWGRERRFRDQYLGTLCAKSSYRTYKSAFYVQRKKTAWADNCHRILWLEILGEEEISGFFCFLWYIFIWLRPFVRALHKGTVAWDSFLGSGGGATTPPLDRLIGWPTVIEGEGWGWVDEGWGWGEVLPSPHATWELERSN